MFTVEAAIHGAARKIEEDAEAAASYSIHSLFAIECEKCLNAGMARMSKAFLTLTRRGCRAGLTIN